MSYTVSAEFLVKEDKIKEFEKLILEHAHQSVSSESGCFVFDVLKSKEIKNYYFLYEIYENEIQYQVHRDTKRYKKNIKIIESLVLKNNNNLFHRRHVFEKISGK